MCYQSTIVKFVETTISDAERLIRDPDTGLTVSMILRRVVILSRDIVIGTIDEVTSDLTTENERLAIIVTLDGDLYFGFENSDAAQKFVMKFIQKNFI